MEKLRSLGRLRKILVDGNNLVLRTRQEASFSGDRNRVIDLLERFTELEDLDVTAVFDSELDPSTYSRGRAKVVFTGRDEPNADLRIEEELAFDAGPDVLVISSDFAHIRPMAEATGTLFMSSEDFRLALESAAAIGTAFAT
ncbi:MAG: NYN domain-containing protein [Actinobacteria bacterium]|nr:NYN domain-containing protein [Actinomycetota bacterium]